jgi:beta-galactosidase
VVDKIGDPCPIALNTMDFSLAGEADWRGGIAQGPDNYILAKSLAVEGGATKLGIVEAEFYHDQIEI